MKIIHILLGKANPERMNGVNVIAHQMAMAQVDAGFDVTVIGLSETGAQDVSRSYNLHIVKQKSRSFRLSQELKDLLINLNKKDIVHFHGVLIPVFSSVAKLLRKYGISYVITPHGALQKMTLKKNWLIKTLYICFFEKSFLNRARRIQAITAYENECLQLVTNTDISVITNACMPAIDNCEIFENKEIVFGYVGRLDQKHKGLDVLIDAFVLFYKQTGQGRLYIIGDGKDREKLSRQAAVIQDRIIFTGEKHGEEKHYLISMIDIFIAPSRWDVLPTSILETCACAKPCIVTCATGFGEMVKKYDAGLVIDNTETGELLEAMMYYRQLKEKGKNAENMVKQEYNWPKVIREIIFNLYGYKNG